MTGRETAKSSSAYRQCRCASASTPMRFAKFEVKKGVCCCEALLIKVPFACLSGEQMKWSVATVGLFFVCCGPEAKKRLVVVSRDTLAYF